MTRYSEMIGEVALPKMAPVRLLFDRPVLEDVAAEIRKEMQRPEILSTIKPGMRIGITGGSRGVANIPLILRTVAEVCREQGAEPFIFPAMGSHGAGRAEGMRDILTSYGITEEACGCPVCCTAETVFIGYTEEGHPVQIDKYAAEADGYIAVNRIKPHTAYRGPYESGLMKMLTIGVGKQQGAEVCHQNGFGDFHHLIPLFGKAIMQHSNLLFGLGTIENAYDETCIIKALTPQEIIDEEPELLKVAKSLMGSLVFEETDVLIVDQIGKNFSGDGADPNITGRFPTQFATGGIKSQRAVILDLTEESHGNATGWGLYDITTKRLHDKVSFEATYPNAITNTVFAVVKMPMFMDNDKAAIMLAVRSCNHVERGKERVIRIKNSRDIETILISEAMLEEAEQNPRIEILGPAEEWPFDENGNLF